jgi:hypothetical protein
VLANFIAGQNGFLSAALIGGALLCIERRPLLAGFFLGLLTYKPHLGLLFPIVLAASGHWRTFAAATATAVAMACASWIAFGSAAWSAFFADIGPTSYAVLSDGVGAAALGVGALLATPYLYAYDLVILAVPLAFLWRLGRARGFLPHELSGIGIACLLVLIFPAVKAPVGLAALMLVAALIARRVLSAEPHAA